MKLTGKLDYLELPATGGTLDSVKAFYSKAFSWSFTDYGPTYSAFGEGLDGGFQADAAEAPARPLPVLYSQTSTRRWRRCATPAAPSPSLSSPSPAAGASISSTPQATNWPCGASRAGMPARFGSLFRPPSGEGKPPREPVESCGGKAVGDCAFARLCL